MLQEGVSDSDLIEKLRSSNEEQKKEIYLHLYERYKNLVLKIAYQRLRDYDLSADVLHDVFVRVIRSVETIKDAAVFKSWIITITKNRCTDLLRKTSHLKNSAPLDPKIEVSMSERTEDVLVANVDKQKMLHALARCIGGLDGFDLNVFKLRWKGLKSEQISRIFSFDRLQMRRCYRRIKNNLETCMESRGLNISIDQIILLGDLDE
jgi:RNA polymerase sigma factor (sigma-70 family)